MFASLIARLRGKSRRPTATACKICNAESPRFGEVDFEKNCENLHYSLSGQKVSYFRCTNCGFLFSRNFDEWTDHEFKEKIYNDEYVVFDQEFSEIRPTRLSNLVISLFDTQRSKISVLDYGGGNGQFARNLRDNEFNASSYDPFYGDKMPDQKFDLITSFEVMEHVPDPIGTASSMNLLLNDVGAILFSTLLQPEPINDALLSWWYVGPRNGHISIFTEKALARLWQPFGYLVWTINPSMHLAVKGRPAFLPPFVLERFPGLSNAE